MSQGAPIGNQNAKKGKAWTDSLRKALLQYENEKTKPGEALDRIAQTVIERAMAGDKDAWQEIGNRLDGKPHQTLDATVRGDLAEVLAGIGRSNDPSLEG